MQHSLWKVKNIFVILYFVSLIYIISRQILKFIRYHTNFYPHCLRNVHVDSRYAPDCNYKYTSEEYIKYSIGLLKAMHTMSPEIPYVLCYGGLIGYHMNNSMLPFDDDVDVLVVGDDAIRKVITYNKWETNDHIFVVHPDAQIMRNVEDKGFEWLDTIFGVSFVNFIDARMICKRTGLYIDVTFFRNTKNKDVYKAMDGNYFKSSDLFPLQKTNFHNVPIHVPNRIENILIKRYGKKLTFKDHMLVDGNWIHANNVNTIIQLQSDHNHTI